MGKLESTIKSEIQRLSKREIRATFVPLRRGVRAMRLRLSSLSKNFSSLNRLTKEQMQNLPKKGSEATPEEVKASGLTPEGSGTQEKAGYIHEGAGYPHGVKLRSNPIVGERKSKPRGRRKLLVALRKFRKRR